MENLIGKWGNPHSTNSKLSRRMTRIYVKVKKTKLYWNFSAVVILALTEFYSAIPFIFLQGFIQKF